MVKCIDCIFSTIKERGLKFGVYLMICTKFDIGRNLDDECDRGEIKKGLKNKYTIPEKIHSGGTRESEFFED